MIVFMALLNETGKGFLDIGMYEWSHFYVTVRSYILITCWLTSDLPAGDVTDTEEEGDVESEGDGGDKDAVVLIGGAVVVTRPEVGGAAKREEHVEVEVGHYQFIT